MHAAPREGTQRRAFVYLDDDGERTITTLGERLVPHGDDPLPWDALDAVGGVYFTGGDAAPSGPPARADVVVATPRAEHALRDSGVTIDVLVHSGKDAGEELDPGELDPAPRTVVTTLGSKGGRWDGEAGSGSGSPCRCRGRAWTPTAPATRSPPASRPGSPAGCRSRTRSRWARAAACRTSPGAARTRASSTCGRR